MPTYGLVLTAAGASTRMGDGPSKVLADLAGACVLARAARPFRAALGVCPTVVTARACDLEAVRAVARAEPALHGAVVVPGGATRQESVAIGVGALPAGVDLVLVHDAARPLLREDLVLRVAEAAWRDGAAAPGLAVTDTIHRVDASGRFAGAVARERLRAAQTPQAARAEWMRRALAEAAAAGLSATDEVGLLLAAGLPVTCVAGDPSNWKITTPEDLSRARAALGERS